MICSGVLLALTALGLPACGPCEGPGELVIDLDDAVIPGTLDLRGIIRIDAGHLVVGTGGAIVRRTRHADWAAIESPTETDLLGVAHWGPRIVAVGRGGTLLQSEDDGLSFAPIELGVGEDLHAAMLDGTRGAIVGDDRALWSSDGGESWAPASLPAGGAALRGVAAEGDTLWAVGLAGALLRSDDDGGSWSAVASPSTADLWGIGYAGLDAEAGLHAVGDGGTILRLESSGWTVIEHELAGDLRAVGGNSIVGLGGLVIAVEIDEGPAPQRYRELDRASARGDLWAIADELAVGDNSRITTIGITWVTSSAHPFCSG
ncbi:MAG: hypothetical protein R6X02_02805 [Enhygromyxa sp.]